jgi:hypothetical protein
MPNKAPEPTTTAVTIRAPSSTARASRGRGSSLTLAKMKASMRSTQSETLNSDAARLSRFVGERFRFEAREESAFDARALGFAASVSHTGSRSQPAGWTKCRSPRLIHGAGTQVILSRVPRLRSGQQGARANAGSCHAACDRRRVEMKNRNPLPSEARGTPAPVVAHL